MKKLVCGKMGHYVNVYSWWSLGGDEMRWDVDDGGISFDFFSLCYSTNR